MFCAAAELQCRESLCARYMCASAMARLPLQSSVELHSWVFLGARLPSLPSLCPPGTRLLTPSPLSAGKQYAVICMRQGRGQGRLPRPSQGLQHPLKLPRQRACSRSAAARFFAASKFAGQVIGEMTFLQSAAWGTATLAGSCTVTAPTVSCMNESVYASML